MQKVTSTKRLENIIRPLLGNKGYELFEIEYKKEGQQTVLRVFIDKKEGISLDDCTIASHLIGEILEENNNIIKQSYILEVSSPGIERKLKKIEDYIRYIGKKINIFFYKPLNGKKSLVGIIVSVNDDVIKINDMNNNCLINFSISDVCKANIIFSDTN